MDDLRCIPARKKSRTLVGRTIAKVKTRIASFGTSDSPNPLRVPPPIIALPYQSTPKSHSPAPYSQSSRTQRNIAALQISTSNWTVFDTHPKYHTTSYINIDITPYAYSPGSCSLIDTSSTPPTSNKPALPSDSGYLYDLEMTISICGPAVKLTEYGCSTHQTLHIGQHWTNVIYIGIKDTSLASKLSTSLRRSINSRRTRGTRDRSNSRIGHKFASNIDLINRWLDVLQNDNDHQAEEINVTATVEYRHSLLPKDTRLKNTVVCKVDRDGIEQHGRLSKNVEDESEFGDVDEERLREARVYGAPWL